MAKTCKVCGAELIEVVVGTAGHEKLTRQYKRRGGKGRVLFLMPAPRPLRYGFPGPPPPSYWADDLVTVRARDLKRLRPVTRLECPDGEERWHEEAELNLRLPYFKARKLGVLREQKR